MLKLAHLDVSRGNWRERASYLNWYDFETGAGIAQTLDPEGQGDYEQFTTDLTYHNPTFTPHWDVMVQFSFSDHNYTANNLI